jgi:hypothetical protein
MSRTRHILAAALTGLALAAAGCGDDEESGQGQTNNEDSVVQDTGTPADEQGQTTPPAGSDEETRTTRTDGE